jgi:hypothetical protein
MNMNLSDYVRVYDNALPEQYCQQLIQQFERHDKKHYQDDDIKRFTEINVVQAGWDIAPLLNTILQYKQRYWSDCGIDDRQIQTNHSWEEIRMKRYLPHVDEFRPHVDTYNLDSMRRFLVYFWYLNDVEDGGETEIYGLDRPMRIQPRQGRLLMFPTTWQYLHAGLIPRSGPKYIIGGYLHYN